MICGAKEPIEESEIVYKDDLVCILDPNVKKGILVWTQYIQPPEMNNLCELELKTEKQLKSKSIPYIFFRAPYYSRDIDYTSVETEIKSSYGEEEIKTEPKVFIRVDPDKTFVFSSEIRNKDKQFIWNDREEHIINNMQNNSKKKLSKYLEIINDNSKIIYNENENSDKKVFYNLFTGKKVLFPIDKEHPEKKPPSPLDKDPIEKNSEIRVPIKDLKQNYFVL
jgi:hypothetical protein